jgi:acetyl esterase/lipase
VSTEQRENLEAVLRQSAFPVGSDVNEQRRLLRELISAQPLPADVTVTAAALGDVPTADLTLAGTTMEAKLEVDALMSREALQARVTDYTAGQDAALGLISPIFADLSGLPPLIIQAGTHEVLLDDAVRLARQAATADVEVTLDLTPRVPHVFQAYHAILDEASAALDRAGQLLSAHLASAAHVTA